MSATVRGMTGGHRVRRRKDLERLLALVLVQPLHQQDPVEVVELVLEDPALQLGGLDGDLVAVEIEADEVHRVRAARSPN